MVLLRSMFPTYAVNLFVVLTEELLPPLLVSNNLTRYKAIATMQLLLTLDTLTVEVPIQARQMQGVAMVKVAVLKSGQVAVEEIPMQILPI